LPYLANLLGAKVGTTLDKVDPEVVGIRTRESLQDVLIEWCRISPVVLFIDDLHWIDSASETLLLRFAERNESTPLLLICAYRPEYKPPWTGRSNATELAVGTLSRGSSIDLAKHRLGVDAVPAELAELLADKCEGNPLFAEEMANYLVESGRVQIADGRVIFRSDDTDGGLPGTLEGILMQRIDRLADGPRRTLRVASVVGRRFPPDLVRDIADSNGNAADELKELEHQELVYPESAQPGSQYQIKHALIRDAVYGSLLSGEREALHLAVAEAIERAYPNNLDDLADTLAHHYSRTDRVDKTVRYLYLAGQKSQRIYSIDDADRRLRQALDLLAANPGIASDTFTIDVVLALARILWLQGDMGATVRMIEPYLAVAEALGDKARLSRCLQEFGHALVHAGRPHIAEPALERALTLAEEVGDEAAVAGALAILTGYSAIYKSQDPAERQRARSFGERAVDIGQRVGDSVIVVVGLTYLFSVVVIGGNPREARDHVQRLLAFSRDQDDPVARHNALLALAIIDLFQGAPDAAFEKVDQALALNLAPLQRDFLLAVKAAALVTKRRSHEAEELIGALRQRSIRQECLTVMAQLGPVPGAAQILNGEFARGLRTIEDHCRWLEEVGFAPIYAASARLALGEVYLQMVLGQEKPPLSVLLRNLGFILLNIPFAAAKARHHLELTARIAEDEGSTAIHAWALMDLGLLAKAKKRSGEARRYLEQAHQLAHSVDAYETAEKSKAALDELG